MVKRYHWSEDVSRGQVKKAEIHFIFVGNIHGYIWNDLAKFPKPSHANGNLLLPLPSTTSPPSLPPINHTSLLAGGLSGVWSPNCPQRMEDVIRVRSLPACEQPRAGSITLFASRADLWPLLLARRKRTCQLRKAARCGEQRHLAVRCGEHCHLAARWKKTAAASSGKVWTTPPRAGLHPFAGTVEIYLFLPWSVTGW